MPTNFLKSLVNSVLWRASNTHTGIRKHLRPYGMRIGASWPGTRPGLVQLANGRTVSFSNIGHSYMAFELHWKGWEYFSPYAILTLQALLRDCGTFFDVGANIGYYSLFAASEDDALQVVAFEPNPENFELLQANSALNGSRLRCVHAAVSDTTGLQVLYLPTSALSGSLEAGFNSAVQRTESVQTWRLDDYIAEHPVAGRPILKVIIEGHEPKFIRGAARLLDEHGPDMILAVSKPYDVETLDLLRHRGYSFYQITNQGLIPEDTLVPCQVDQWFFLEHLVTRRSADEIRGLNSGLLPRFRAIPIAATNLNRPDLAGKGSVW